MKKITYSIFLVLFVIVVKAQCLSLEWVTTINTNKSAITGTHLREDNRILIKGFYQDYLNVNNDTLIYESDESQDTYLIELSEDGNGNWGKRFELTSGEVYNKISSQENIIYNHGWLTSWPSTPGEIEFQEVPINTIDTAFNLIGTDSDFDSLGNIYATGSFQNIYDFDPSSDSEILTSLHGSDSFVAKYDSSRNLIWAKSFPGLGWENGRTLALDQDNNVIIVSNLTDSIDIDLNATGYELPNGDGQNNSFFMVKLSSNGSLEWYKAFQSSERMQINDLTVNTQNSIIATGSFTGTLIYDIAGTEYSLTSKGEEDAFVAKLNSQGDYEWVRQIECTNDAYGLKVEVDHNNFTFNLGSYYDTLTVIPSIDSFHISQGFSDSYLRIYDDSGNQLKSYTYGGNGFDWARDMHIDKSSNLYLISAAGSNIDVDLEVGEFLIQTSGTRPSFVAKYKVCLPEEPYNGIDDDCDSTTLDDDLDQDGFLLANDCDDNNSNINPDQPEEPYNGIDDDCDSNTLDDDLDQDGFLLADDCDDNDPNINPNQTEEPYNGIDDDCDPNTLDDDLDQDGYILADDCDDNNPNINPDAEDIPNNGIDEDCDGLDTVSSTYEIGNSTINIFPNPTVDEINIEIIGELSYQANLFDLNGKLVVSKENKNQIEVNSIPKGTYLLEIKDLKTGAKIIEKIIIGK